MLSAIGDIGRLMQKNRPASNRYWFTELDTASEVSTALDEFDRADCALGVIDEPPSAIHGFYSNIPQDNIAIQRDACVVVIRDPATTKRNWVEYLGRPPGAVRLTSEHGTLFLKAATEHSPPTTWPMVLRSPSLTQRFAEALKLQDVEDALDVIFNAVDSALTAGRFRECNRALASVSVDEWPTDLLGGLLSITAAASHELPARAAFFERTRRVVIERGDDTPGLLDGLE